MSKRSDKKDSNEPKMKDLKSIPEEYSINIV